MFCSFLWHSANPNICHFCLGQSKQHAGLFLFKRVGWCSDACEQRVAASVLLTVLDQVSSCQGDLKFEAILNGHISFKTHIATWETWKADRVKHTLILSMLASSWSWATSFCAWATLLLLHTLPDIALHAEWKIITLWPSYIFSIFTNGRSKKKKKKCFTSCNESPLGVQECLVRKGPIFLLFSYAPWLLFIHPWCPFKGFVTLKVIHHGAGNVILHTNVFPCFQ